MLELKPSKINIITTYAFAIIAIIFGSIELEGLGKLVLIIFGIILLILAIKNTIKPTCRGVFDKNGFTTKNGTLISWEDIHSIIIKSEMVGKTCYIWAEINYGDNQTEHVDINGFMSVDKFVERVNEIACRDVVSKDVFKEQVRNRRKKSLIGCALLIAIFMIIGIICANL